MSTAPRKHAPRMAQPAARLWKSKAPWRVDATAEGFKRPGSRRDDEREDAPEVRRLAWQRRQECRDSCFVGGCEFGRGWEVYYSSKDGGR